MLTEAHWFNLRKIICTVQFWTFWTLSFVFGSLSSLFVFFCPDEELKRCVRTFVCHTDDSKAMVNMVSLF